MIRPAETTTVTMTIYKIEADLVDVTRFGDPHPSHVLGYVTVYAVGGGRRHQWQQTSGRVYVGDTVEVQVSEPRTAGQ